MTSTAMDMGKRVMGMDIIENSTGEYEDQEDVRELDKKRGIEAILIQSTKEKDGL
jgi:hypothetical protein